MNADPTLLLRVAVAVVAVAAGLGWLARRLGRPLTRWALGVGLMLPCAVLAPWLGGGDLLVPGSALRGLVPGTNFFAERDAHGVELNDVVYQFLPWELEVRRALGDGQLPLWSDVLDGGGSPWVNLCAAVFSPAAMAARIVPIEFHLLVSLSIKLLIAFTGAWVLARSVGVSRRFALLGGVGWSLSGAFAAWGLFPHSDVSAWAPWLAAASIALVRRPSRARLLATAALAAIVLVAGHPEVALAAGVFAALLAWLYRRRDRLPAERRSWRMAAKPWRGWLQLGLACGIGVGLASPVLVPFAFAVEGSQRAVSRVAVPSSRAPEASSSRPWFGEGRIRLFPAMTNPHAYGRPYLEPYVGPPNLTISVASTHYAGLVAWAGALVGLMLAGRRVAPLAGLAVVLVALSARFAPLAGIADAAEWSRAIEWTRILPMAGLALALAGAIGFECLSRSRGRPRWLGWASLVVGVAVASSARLDAWTATMGLAVLASAILASSAMLSWRRWGGLGLALVAAIELGAWFVKFMPRGAPGDFFPRTPLVEAIDREAKGRRVLGHDYLAYPSTLSVFGLADARPNNVLAPAVQVAALKATLGFSFDDEHYYGVVNTPTHPFGRFLNVGLVISNQFLPPLEGWSEVAGDWAPWRLWAAAEEVPEIAFVATRVDFVAGRELAKSLAELDDPRRVFLVSDESVSALTTPVAGAASDRVAVLSRRPGRIRLHYDLSGSAVGSPVLIATSLPSPKGWTAIDRERGVDLPRFAVHGAYAGFAVPGGTAGSIDLRFRPPGYRTGWFLFAVALAAVVGVLAFSRRSSVR